MNVTAAISQDSATPAVADLMARTRPDRLARICRQPLETFWSAHLADYPRLPGKFAAFPDTGFGESASRSVYGFALESGGDSAAVTLEARQLGLALRYWGGTIKPVSAKILCFPITPEAYGKNVWNFGYTGAKPDPGLRQKLRANFAFARSITFAPNPAVVPSDDEFQEVAMAAIERRLAA